MDIVTHGMMGVVVAAPLFESNPLAACGVALGSALPDLDALSRVFGKRAFLRSHQTVTHSIPVILACGVVVGFASSLSGLDGPEIAIGLVAGMLLHIFLDVCNTYGITLLLPFSRRRICLEWVFFIDAFVLVATVVALVVVIAQTLRSGQAGSLVPAVYAGVLAAYFLGRGLLRRRAGRLAAVGTLSLMPSALIPWTYLGCARDGDDVLVFCLNGVTGRMSEQKRVPILDADWTDLLATVPEVKVMRRLSPAYHVVSVKPRGGATELLLRDLRTRNFSTRFGDLEVRVGEDGRVASTMFHV